MTDDETETDEQPEPAPGPLEFVRGALPGLTRPSVAALSLASALLALAVGYDVACRGGNPKAAAVALVSWAHGAAWLTTGEVQRLDSALAELHGATWGVMFALFFAPVWIAWVALGAMA